MSKRKGLSFEEKRMRLTDFFYETKDFWQLKDVEKLASKSKGIVTQSIKEVLDSLVADNIVTAEKIGTSNYFWSFPSAAVQTRKRKIDDLEAELKVLKQKNIDVQRGITEAQNGRENSDHRADLLRRLLETEAARTAKLAELEQFRDCDPTLVEEKERAVETAKEAANRWTENMFALQSYCSRTFGIPAQQFSEQFSIPEEFDTIP